MKFTKMHGLGNDFIIIDNREGREIDFPGLAGNLCRRRFSVGADGILVLANSRQADLRMIIYNSDGSEAEMCGNGIRCFAKYCYENHIIDTPEMKVETKAGIIKPAILKDPESGETLVRVNMGIPELSRDKIPVAGEGSEKVIDEPIEINGENFLFSAVSMGNPHCVIFVEEPTDRLVRGIGPIIEKHELFPKKTNVEFIKIENPNEIKFRVWERGAGETLACGTGACASVVAGILKGVLKNDVKVKLPGGDLFISWDGSGPVYMTGPAEEVFRGELSNI